MFHILESTQYVADMHFMLQKEVVDRICAEPGSKTYGRLSVMMAYFCEPEWLFDVPPESFYPVPQVTSAIVRLVPHQTPPVQIKSLSDFQHLVTQAFCQRRKTIRNSLKNLVSEEKMLALGIEPSLRAEALGLQEFALLANALE